MQAPGGSGTGWTESYPALLARLSRVLANAVVVLIRGGKSRHCFGHSARSGIQGLLLVSTCGGVHSTVWNIHLPFEISMMSGHVNPRYKTFMSCVLNLEFGNGFEFDLILASIQGCLFFITEMVLGHNDLVPGENMTEYQKWLGELHRKSPCWGVQSWFLGINIQKPIASKVAELHCSLLKFWKLHSSVSLRTYFPFAICKPGS